MTVNDRTAEDIIKEIDKVYPKVKDLVRLAGMDKSGWIAAALLEAEMGEHVHFIRCENCIFYECDGIQSLKGEYPDIVKVWVTHGCHGCPKFSPKPDAEGLP